MYKSFIHIDNFPKLFTNKVHVHGKYRDYTIIRFEDWNWMQEKFITN